MDINNLITTAEKIMPLANKFFPNSPLVQKANEYNNIISIIKEIGDIKKITQLFNNDKEEGNIKITNNHYTQNGKQNERKYNYKLLDIDKYQIVEE